MSYSAAFIQHLVMHGTEWAFNKQLSVTTKIAPASEKITWDKCILLFSNTVFVKNYRVTYYKQIQELNNGEERKAIKFYPTKLLCKN